MSKNQDLVDSIDRGEYPEQVLIPLDNNFEDERGQITNLVLAQMSSAAIITSKAGSVRANHYHKSDNHFAYVISGEIEYYHRKVGDTDPPRCLTITQGQMFFTPPMVEHTMVFRVDTVFLTLARNIRTHENHEADLVRVKLV